MKYAIAILFCAAIAGSFPAAAGKSPKHALDGEELYKENCMRCHIALRTFSARSMRTAMLHMREKANLTQDETDAIYKYLVGDETPGAPGHGASASTKGAGN